MSQHRGSRARRFLDAASLFCSTSVFTVVTHFFYRPLPGVDTTTHTTHTVWTKRKALRHPPPKKKNLHSFVHLSMPRCSPPASSPPPPPPGRRPVYASDAERAAARRTSRAASMRRTRAASVDATAAAREAVAAAAADERALTAAVHRERARLADADAVARAAAADADAAVAAARALAVGRAFYGDALRVRAAAVDAWPGEAMLDAITAASAVALEGGGREPPPPPPPRAGRAAGGG